MSQFERTNARLADALHAVLIEFGGTKVLCTALVEEKVPGHKKASGNWWPCSRIHS
jgi:ribonuclease PH